ncbi:MAG: HAMP domain-containing protein [Rhodothermaceae bacterium]|nr:HAMP domain-containing protein [Rhodothermaceae bacterium]
MAEYTPTGDGSRRGPPSFRRRLTLTLGSTLALALGAFGGLVLLGAWAFMTYSARQHLASEVTNIATQVVHGGQLDLDAPPWDEPHHRFTEPHIDPHFVQVFDADGRPLRSSANVARLGDDFPARLLPVTGTTASLEPLRTFEASSIRFYHLTTPLTTGRGRLLGYLQVSRYAPPISAMLRRLGLGLAVGYVVALAGLIALLWAVGGRVVRPLEAMTASARALSPERLSQRVPVPPDADRETTELGRALNDALARLEDAFVEVRRFTADAAHELQTPLTVLLGHIEVALRRERSPEAYRDTLGVLREEAEDMVRTVRGLLALARMEAPQPSAEPVPLGQIAREETEAVRPRAEKKGLMLTVNAESEAYVMGHPALLREAVRNLLDNAVKYTDTGEVRVRVGRRDGQVVLAVEDTGSGIAEEHLPHVTRRFWRADGVQHLPGSGLGLSLVEQVAAHHGGRFRIDSESDTGTHAEMMLPTG